jgi:hypothetical protein
MPTSVDADVARKLDVKAPFWEHIETYNNFLVFTGV